jgi:short subunit dehydrogenase-like uncharacterized protein
MSKVLDVVIFGASGYTGKFVTRQMSKVFKKESIKFGIAGNTLSDLKHLLRDVSSQESLNFEKKT